MFFTWNGSNCQFHSYFDEMKKQLPDLPIQLSIGKSICYLDVEIIQCNGKLQMQLYRPGLVQPDTIPYLTNYPLNQYPIIIHGHLIHSIHLCTNVEHFQKEHSFIYSSCLLNRIPLDSIMHCIHDFFHEFNPSKSNYQYNQKTYENLRQSVMISMISMRVIKCMYLRE